MQVAFATIALNESEYLGQCLAQHYELCDRWIIVEGADRRVPPSWSTEDGLSVDGTADIVRRFPDPQRKIELVQHGWAADKSELRNRYAERIEGDGVVIVFDADEFLRLDHLRWLIDQCRELPGPGSIRIPHIHFWKHDGQIIIGGYYDVPHDRAYRWADGVRYTDNHNHPALLDGRYLQQVNYRKHSRNVSWRPPLAPNMLPMARNEGRAWLHYGFCKTAGNVAAKNAYYVNRGESTTRPDTTRDRRAWFESELPDDCKLLGWEGPWPELMMKQKLDAA